MDPHFIENSDSTDNLGVIDFLTELSSKPALFKGFGTTIQEMTPLFTLPLNSMIAKLNSTNLWHHNVLCPIICLKNDLVIGVFENVNRTKCTHFYSVSCFSNQVEYKHFNGYTKLMQRENVLYCYSSKTSQGNSYSVGHYRPDKDTQVNFDTSLLSRFSYMGRSNFKRLLIFFAEYHQIKVVDEHNHSDLDFRPETATVAIHTHIRSKSSPSTFEAMMQMGLKHHASILIFPSIDKQDGKSMWDSCIIHHPYQHKVDALDKLKHIVPNTESETYAYHTTRGLIPNNCESGFYMMLYSFIGHRTCNVNKFIDAIKQLQSEDDIDDKVRRWIHSIVNNTTHNHLPSWIEQVICQE